MKSLKFLIPYVARYKWKYIAGAVFVFFTNVFRIWNPRVVQHAIDLLKSQFGLYDLAYYSGFIILLAILEGIFLFLMRRSMIVASREIENDLRNDFFQKLTELSPSFYQKMPTGDIMSRATNDLNAVRAVTGPGIAYSINTISAFLFVLPMMLLISPRLTLFALLPFPVVDAGHRPGDGHGFIDRRSTGHRGKNQPGRIYRLYAVSGNFNLAFHCPGMGDRIVSTGSGINETHAPNF